MTPEEPPDDEVFINSDFLANGPIQKAGVKPKNDQPSFPRIATITGRCPAEWSASKATASFVFRTKGLGSAESEGAGPGIR
jgi:hypothetical protein